MNLCVGMWYMHVCEIPVKVRRGRWVFWRWSYRWLWADLQWMLGTEFGSSARRTGALNCWLPLPSYLSSFKWSRYVYWEQIPGNSESYSEETENNWIVTLFFLLFSNHKRLKISQAFLCRPGQHWVRLSSTSEWHFGPLFILGNLVKAVVI